MVVRLPFDSTSWRSSYYFLDNIDDTNPTRSFLVVASLLVVDVDEKSSSF